jgi:HAD superfamily phosphatase (TIGR01668 family)
LIFKIFDRMIKPDEFYQNLQQIDFAEFARQGFRLIMLDIDNTLARHGSTEADDYARTAVGQIKAAGLSCWIISNGAVKRVQHYAASLELPFVAMAGKPSTRAMKAACRSVGIQPTQAAMIGDQLLTDIFGARRAGCRAVLVKPRFCKEAWSIRVKRIFEKIVLRRYQMH